MTAAIQYIPVCRGRTRGTVATIRSVADEQAARQEQPEILLAQRGDHGAFALLVRRHQQRAYAVCRAVLGNHEDAEDAVQEGFLKAFRAIAQFEPGQPFGAWLHRIMVNASRDVRRRRALRATEELTDSMIARGRDVTDWISRARLLASSLSALTERQRAAVVLHDVEGFTHAEIGDMLGIPAGTTKYDLHVARRALRECLARHRQDF